MKTNKKKIAKKEHENDNIILEEDNLFEKQDESPKKWFEEIAADPKKFDGVTEQILIELKEEAKKCHDSETANYNIKNSRTNSDFQWMKTVMDKGTISDKIAAYVVTIQNNPICNLETVRKLVGMVKVAKKRECVMVMETLSDLFVGDLLRPKSLLKAFHERPLSRLNQMSSGNAVTRRKLLSAWYFEDQLKEIYTTLIMALNTVAHDTVDNHKEKAITAMYKLLVGNSEQESNLLSCIVNKLGDPSAKVASKAIYCLGQLLFKQQSKQTAVLNQIEKLLFRSNISTRAQYYSLCFVSQFYLSHKNSDVARRLVELYFSFFKACIKKGEVDSRMMSALLMGVNRAYPYAKIEMDKMKEHIDTMYRVVHVASFNVSIHALNLLFQVCDQSEGVTDRFYSALYKKLIDPQLTTTTHQAMVLSLVYKALLKDKETKRVKAFIKRLLQVSLHSQVNFTCALLFLVSQITNKKTGLQAIEIKESPLSEFDDDEVEEKYEDVKIEDDTNEAQIQNNETLESKVADMISAVDVELPESTKPTTSWYHCNNSFTGNKFKPITKFNPFNRNPLYAGGEHCAYLELLYLRNHCHPTVALYSKNILEGTVINYSGDPLKDFTIIRFLDRFAFKNPKKYEESSQGAHPTFGRRKTYVPRGVKSMSIMSNTYLNEDQKNIPADEMFMYMYLQQKYANRKLKDEEESDVESVQSNEFEEMLNNMGNMKDVDDELDYMNDVGIGLANKNNKKKKEKNDDSEDDDIDDDSDDDNEISDDENELDDIDDFKDDATDEDLNDIDDMNGDDAESMDFGSSAEDISDEDTSDKKTKKRWNNGKNKKNDDMSSLFASADEFATLLEEEASSKVAPGSSNVFANKDKAGVKQLAWEEKRNRWVQGFNKVLNNKKRKHSGNKNFGNKKFAQKYHKKRKTN